MGKVRFGAALAGMALLGAGVAWAQIPPPGPGQAGGPPPPPGVGPGMPFGADGPGMERGRPFGPGMHGPMRRPPRAAVFSINRGDTRVFIKCSDEESTRACVDAATSLLDKLGGSTPR